MDSSLSSTTVPFTPDPSHSRSSSHSSERISEALTDSDEIVWSVHGDDDVVLINAKKSDGETYCNLSAQVAKMSITDAKKASNEQQLKPKKEQTKAYSETNGKAKKKYKKKYQQTGKADPQKTRQAPLTARSNALVKPSGLTFGTRSVVNDFSDSESVATTSPYEEAVGFLNAFLSNPSAKISRLHIMQSLIVELGLISVVDGASELPTTVRAAKALLQSRAFINVRDYLAVRAEGQAALQQVMYPSRKALAMQLRSSPTERASRKYIKDSGLGVFLVPCFYH